MNKLSILFPAFSGEELNENISNVHVTLFPSFYTKHVLRKFKAFLFF